MSALDSAPLPCIICKNAQGNGTHRAKEMMFGLGMEFNYMECASCGSLLLTDPPVDSMMHYPARYYKFGELEQPRNAKNRVRQYVRIKRNASYFGNGGLLGRLLAQRYEDTALLAISKLGIDRNSRILDVGCGNGKLLLRLHELGFRNLEGLDPLLPHDVHHRNGIRIRNCYLVDLIGKTWDVVMFHHSLEHIPNPVGTLQTVVHLLVPGGKCLVRLPVVSWAWEYYGASWAQLDPPRHMWLPTERAMRILVDTAGLKFAGVEFDSTEFQFSVSELYLRGIPLSERNSTKLHTRRELAEFRRRARALNREGRGDQAAFFLEKQ